MADLPDLELNNLFDPMPSEAQARITINKLLEAAGWDYYVEADEYSGGFLFKTQRTGAFFYVLAEKAAEARVFLESKGYKPQPALPVEG